MTTQTKIKVSNVSKTFVLHNQNGIELDVLKGADFNVASGECVVLNGRSGSGKSTLLRALYANYLVDTGDIEVEHQGRWSILRPRSHVKSLMYANTPSVG